MASPAPVAFVVVPAGQLDYIFRAILIPFLILSLAALGVNILVGYCGQISLGHRRLHGGRGVRGLQLLRPHRRHAADRRRCCWAACAPPSLGMLFGIPSLRIKGLYLAVATLAAQFFIDWSFLRIKWFTNNSSSGSVSVAGLQVLGLPIETPMQKYLFCLALVCVVRR